MTSEGRSTESDDYRALVEGRISPDEYAQRLRAAVEAEAEQQRVAEEEQRARIDELVKGPAVFLSYAHEDQEVARSLSVELEKRGAAVWIDEGELRIGDSIIEQVAKAIRDVEYVVVLISPASVGSTWVAKELSLASTRVLERQGVKVMPVRIGDVSMPASLADLFYLQLDPGAIPDAADRLFRDILRHRDELPAHQQASRPEPGPSPELWSGPIADLVDRALMAAQRDESVFLTRMLNSLPAAARDAATDEARFGEVLDRLASVTAAFLVHEFGTWAQKAIRGFERVYNDTFDAHGAPVVPGPQRLWLHIIVRIEAVGALAVRLKQWDRVREIALTPLTGERDAYNPFVLRHGLTMASRAGLFDHREQDRVVQLSLIVMARDRAMALPELIADSPPNEDAVLNSVCQFDFLAALTAIDAGGSPDTRFFYTNFARFHTWRAEGALRVLLNEPAMRDVVFRSSDQALALALRVIDRLAHSEAVRFNGWDGFRDPVVLRFLEENPVDEELVRRLW